VILVAGVVTCLAALGALLRLREREVRYSEAIAHYGEELPCIPDLRPDGLERKPLPRPGWAASLDRKLRALAGRSGWPAIHHVWVLALLLFAVADIVAFVATT
jgi:hypothetical protein